MTTKVRLEHADGIATITLDGAEKLNAFSSRTAQDLSEAYRECDSNDDIRVVVLTGAGRAFCAGADLSEEARSFAPQGSSFSASPLKPAAWDVRKLVIAAINGHAIGIGFTIALQCDLRIVADNAKLAIPQVRLGMLGDAQSHYSLRAIAGTGVAADLLLTGRTVTGADAVPMGIASQVVAADAVLPTALAIARDVAENVSPASVALSKRILWDDLPRADVVDRETLAHHILMAHPDAAEGPAAWREKRAPQWGLKVSELPDQTHEPGTPYSIKRRELR